MAGPGANVANTMSVSSDGRKFKRYLINAPGRLIAIRPGLSGMTFRNCRLVDISQGGAALIADTVIGLPDHYYLKIADFPDRLGCAEVYRDGNKVGVKFIKELDAQFIKDILSSDHVRVSL